MSLGLARQGLQAGPYRLAPLAESDIRDLLALFGDPAVVEFMDIDPLESLAEARDIVAWARELALRERGLRWSIRRQGQAALIHLSDPMVRGDNYLGTADWTVGYFLSFHTTLLAILKVLAVVAGHVVGVVAAHDRAISLLPPRHHVTGQVGLLVVMVAYTATGLYLLMGGF